ncbi:NAD-dependent epimerase/dehydratase family protein [Rhodococcus sp. BUPNP1]|uniref:NAD-dependent epimerase/dehydratase family protein n=1 Tax=Rhodococcus sp. BUPNP1 TaxID=1432786 RepID=UPI000B5A8244|nr:NAD-dependent epimerase/dehydratase family protein [Rhodococcus sp. BUPNP1]OWY81679.1 UDP-glucose 4-epimerase [Rhodococcus sp. BUPNP1]
MKVLVTGAAGFVGSSLVKKLIMRSDIASVVGVDSFTDYYDPSLKRLNLLGIDHSKFQLIEEDLVSTDIASLLDGVDYVFHQAGQPGVRASWGENFSVYTDRNVIATQRLLEGSREHPTLQKFVYASSSSVYGNSPVYPTREDMLPRPVSPYGVTKLAAEHLCSLYAANFGVPTVSLRYFTVYGPGQRPDMLFQRIMRSALLGEQLRIFGTGEQVRDFTYVDDVVEANLAAAFSGVMPGFVCNVSGGSNISVNEVLDIVYRLSDGELSYERVGAVAGDVVRTGGDSSLASTHLGWKPLVDIESGLDKMWRHSVSLHGSENK